MADFAPTAEQHAICEAVSRGENVMVEALAGCAKSTTIELSVRQVPRNKSVLVLAFNVKIKKEMEARLATLPNVKVRTLNGAGHLSLLRNIRNVSIDKDKVFTLAKTVGFRGDDFTDLLQLIRHARMAGLVPRGFVGKPILEDTPETWADLCDDLDIDPILAVPARDILAQSIKQALAGTIDFDDQLYISTMLGYPYEKFDVVFVDEAQDLSPMNHLQVKASARGQIVVVGDSHQAIYAFRGADHNSMENIRCLRSQWTDLTLSTTFRCPRSVVKRQNSFVPLFTAGPDNLEGSVSILKQWSPEPNGSSAILCRNNAPILRAAFRLLRHKVPAQIIGTDIGKNLKSLYNKLSNHGKKDLDQVRQTCKEKMEEDPKKADKYDSLTALLENMHSVDEALKFLQNAGKNSIALATGHRAKGLEWDTVYHLEPGLIPSIHVMKMEEGEAREAAMLQERNLRYVIETRTKNALNFVKLENLL